MKVYMKMMTFVIVTVLQQADKLKWSALER